jgi:hypothetical protein
VVKLADDVEFLIAFPGADAGVDAWNVALADELRALGEGAGNVGGRPGDPVPKRPWEFNLVYIIPILLTLSNNKKLRK